LPWCILTQKFRMIKNVIAKIAKRPEGNRINGPAAFYETVCPR